MKSLVPHAIALAVSALVATSAIAADNSAFTPRAENPYLSQSDAAARRGWRMWPMCWTSR